MCFRWGFFCVQTKNKGLKNVFVIELCQQSSTREYFFEFQWRLHFFLPERYVIKGFSYHINLSNLYCLQYRTHVYCIINYYNYYNISQGGYLVTASATAVRDVLPWNYCRIGCAACEFAVLEVPISGIIILSL